MNEMICINTRSRSCC